MGETRERKINPERLSGHNLVKYLLANPDAAGNFKWHTLRSCMWQTLLQSAPQFAPFADYQKITHSDALKIVNTHPDLTSRFPGSKFNIYDWLGFLLASPELISVAPVENFNGFIWSLLLQRHPDLEAHCPWDKFSGTNWCYLLIHHKRFADRCPWEKFTGQDWMVLLKHNSSYAEHCNWSDLVVQHWLSLLFVKKRFLADLKLEYVRHAAEYQKILRCCYFGQVPPPGGLFSHKELDSASYLIYKNMDKENAKRYLKMQYEKGNWAFIEELCDISPEEAIAVDGKKYMPFYLILTAPDSLFKKYFQTVNPDLRDPAGNTLLLPALIYGLTTGDMTRYEFLLSKGLDPEYKNLAGYSCNDAMQHFQVRNKKG